MKRSFMYTVVLVILLSFLLFQGCAEDEDDESCDPVPSTCHGSGYYTTGSLSIRLTINSENPTVKMHVFEGDVEDGNYCGDISPNPFDWSSSSYSVSGLSLGNYSAKVDYKVGGVTVTAIDGDEIHTTTTEHCGDVTCYHLENAKLDLTFDVEAFRDYLDGTDEECFIATAAFGSPLAREVAILRNFRDSVLRGSAPGRMFIALYYRFSPSAAELIRSNEGLRTITRGVLYPVVWGVAHPIGFFGVIVILGIGGAVVGIRRKNDNHEG